MSETVKLRSFCSEPMGQKLINQVPGVGHIAARKLRSISYTKARDLYNRLKLLGFDEKKFRVWITINCKGAKTTTIYRALMGYHAQFGDQETDDVEISRSDTQRAPHAARNTRPAAVGRRTRPRSSVQFDLPATNVSARERENDIAANDTLRFNNHSNDALTLFFASFSDSCKNISKEYHTDLKLEVLAIVSKYEKKTRERQNVSQNGPTSTSFATNGTQ